MSEGLHGVPHGGPELLDAVELAIGGTLERQRKLSYLTPSRTHRQPSWFFLCCRLTSFVSFGLSLVVLLQSFCFLFVLLLLLKVSLSVLEATHSGIVGLASSVDWSTAKAIVASLSETRSLDIVTFMGAKMFTMGSPEFSIASCCFLLQ